jgi:hypothetical protein
MKLPLLLWLALLLALPAHAIEEPEAAYARYHRGIFAGSAADMLQNSAGAERAELAAQPPVRQVAIMQSLSTTVPRAYVLRAKDFSADGQSARLVLNGVGIATGSQRPETLYGTIRMVVERGEWKVAGSEWSPREPGPAAFKPAAKSAGAAAAPVPPKGSPPVVGSMSAAPERKLGVAKEPCVFKPVMTAEDLENCK